jgi:phosphotriesterase-related protein
VADVPTARGDVVDSSELGFTLPAEQVFGISNEININWPDFSFGVDPEQVERRVADAVRALEVAHEHGIQTLVDRCIPGIGRNVPLLKRVADRAPVNVILCTGYYTWNDLPGFFLYREQVGVRYSEEPTMEDLFVRDLEVGIAGTNVRAGLIKIVSDRDGLTPGVELTMRSAARAHRRTGAPLTSHTGVGIGTKSGLLQQRLLSEEGVDLSRVIIGHVDFTPAEVPLGEFMELMDRGSCIAFDTFGLGPPYSFPDVSVDRIVELCMRGYADRILLSHDNACFVDYHPEGSALKRRLRESGLPLYTQISHEILPRLRERGVSDAQIDQMTIRNPRRIFETRSLGPY